MFDAFLDRYAELNPLMACVLVARGSDVIYEGCRGQACSRQTIEKTAQFRIASITKQFVGVAALLCAEKGLVDLDQPIKHYTNLHPEGAGEVTLRQLLNHTSGLLDYHSHPDYKVFKDKSFTSREFMALFKDQRPVCNPGEEFHYSGLGYALAGVVIEEVSGMTLQKGVHTWLLEPLGMTDTFFPLQGQVTDLRTRHPRLALGHHILMSDIDRSVSLAATRDLSTSYAGGGMISTARDLLIWNQALHQGDVLRDDSYAQLVPENGYGLGISRSYSKMLKEWAVWHSGGTEGYNTQLAYYPSEDITICVLMNLEIGGAVNLATRLGRELFKRKADVA